MKKAAAGALAILASVAVPSTASAFSGMYVAKGDARLTSKIGHVVVMRDGVRTIVSMQNDYVGPPQPFAMVVPLPAVVAKESVHTLAKESFDVVDHLGSPRLVEYWEQDPCGVASMLRLTPPPTKPAATVDGGPAKPPPDLAVLAEAAYAVGEYDVVVLSAEDSRDVEAWLRREGYTIPQGGEAYLRPYVERGSTFLVAKVDTARVKFENGRAVLSPLRFHYDAPELGLPVRIGLANSPGEQELVVDILADKRYEAADYPSVTIPTNLDVAETTRDEFSWFYTALFDRTLEKTPKAIVTEYAWGATSCDPCPGPPLRRELATFGGDVLPAEASPEHASVVLPRGILSDATARAASGQLTNTLRTCFQPIAAKSPDLRGVVELTLSYDESGAAKSVTFTKDEIKSPELTACVKSAASGVHVPRPAAAGNVALSFTVTSMVERRWRSWTLTRLHARVGKDTFGEDIVFKEAPPIAGGRESRDPRGLLERGAASGDVNAFEARYAIRHPWRSALACASPRRGVWGAAPNKDAAAKPDVAAFASRLSSDKHPVDLAALVKSDAPEIDLHGPPPAAAPEGGADTQAAPEKSEGAHRGCSGGPSCSVGFIALALFARRRKRT
jgi:hypothetical protein